MTPSELITELKLILKVHPEAKDHTLFADLTSAEGHLDTGRGGGCFQIKFLRYDSRHKRIILEGVD